MQAVYIRKKERKKKSKQVVVGNPHEIVEQKNQVLMFCFLFFSLFLECTKSGSFESHTFRHNTDQNIRQNIAEDLIRKIQ